MCICINCKQIRKCKTYDFIAKQHGHKAMITTNNYFTPLSTMIIVNINKENKNVCFDWDVQECSSFTEKPGYWIILS